jgi:hypothetical protein
MKLHSTITTKLSGEARAAIENYAIEEEVSLATAARHFIRLGIENHKRAMA